MKHASTYKFHQINQSKINFISHSKWVYNNFLNTNETQYSPIDHIKYSININKFKSKDKTEVRKKFKIPKSVFVIMTTAVGILSNPFKDFKTLFGTLGTKHLFELRPNIIEFSLIYLTICFNYISCQNQ